METFNHYKVEFLPSSLPSSIMPVSFSNPDYTSDCITSGGLCSIQSHVVWGLACLGRLAYVKQLSKPHDFQLQFWGIQRQKLTKGIFYFFNQKDHTVLWKIYVHRSKIEWVTAIFMKVIFCIIETLFMKQKIKFMKPMSEARGLYIKPLQRMIHPLSFPPLPFPSLPFFSPS